MRLALATCAELPSWEVDDRFLHAALAARGVEVAQPPWSDPSVDWARFDAVLIRTTWDYQFHREAFVAWAERVARHTLLFNPAALVRWNTHKSYLRELEVAGVALAPTTWVPAGRSIDLARLVRERGWTRGFIKPLLGATARETLRFDARVPEALARAQAHLDRTVVAQAEDMMVQPYLDSVEREGELSLVWFAGRLSHGVRKVPVPGDYRVQDDFGAHDEPWSADGAALALSAEVFAALAPILARLGVDAPLLYARVDMLRVPSGALVLNELELVEPSLFFRHAPSAGETLADAIIARVHESRGTPPS